jgi:CRP-like cAMP-binding protein
MTAQFKLLHEYPLFDGLSKDQMQAVMQICREECFLPDTVLFTEGEPAKELFILVDGEVEESFTIDEAMLSLLHPVGPGEIIGCPALAPPYIQSCTTRCLTQVEVLAIDAVGLRDLFARDCETAVIIQQHVIQALLERIGKMQIAGITMA